MLKILEYNRRCGSVLRNRLSLEAFPPDKLDSVRGIIREVRARGDAALRAYTLEFDGVKIGRIAVPAVDFRAARKLLTPKLKKAFRRVRDNIAWFHSFSQARSWTAERADGAVLGEKVTPLASAGLYIPGGNAPLVSTVLMAAVPAQLAGVKRIALVSPPGRNGKVNPWVLAAADFLGLREVYRIGGAQAVAALAFGTESVKPVLKIAGPGNIYVTLAKKEVYGYVDIDMLAGPSEIAILADGSPSAEKIAADLLAQAEHGAGGFSFLISTSRRLLEDTAAALPGLLRKLGRREILEAAIRESLALIRVPSLAAGADLINRLAPEHLEILTREPAKVLPRIRNAGAVFLGPFSPVAAGDYIAGPSHILPTGGGARSFSPLSPGEFLKKSSLIEYSRSALAGEIGLIEHLARLEGLDAHALSALVSLGEGE